MTPCEICGRPVEGVGMFSEAHVDPSHFDDCYKLGWEREKARADKAERDLRLAEYVAARDIADARLMAWRLAQAILKHTPPSQSRGVGGWWADQVDLAGLVPKSWEPTP